MHIAYLQGDTKIPSLQTRTTKTSQALSTESTAQNEAIGWYSQESIKFHCMRQYICIDNNLWSNLLPKGLKPFIKGPSRWFNELNSWLQSSQMVAVFHVSQLKKRISPTKLQDTRRTQASFEILICGLIIHQNQPLVQLLAQRVLGICSNFPRTISALLKGYYCMQNTKRGKEEWKLDWFGQSKV